MKRGGSRPGAGRPAKDQQNRVQLSIRVKPKTKDLMRKLRADRSYGELVDDLVEAASRHEDDTTNKTI